MRALTLEIEELEPQIVAARQLRRELNAAHVAAVTSALQPALKVAAAECLAALDKFENAAQIFRQCALLHPPTIGSALPDIAGLEAFRSRIRSIVNSEAIT
jgi:hypothetical protein